MEPEQNYIVEEKSSHWVLPVIGLLVFMAGGAIYYYFTYLNNPEAPAAINTDSETLELESLTILNYGLDTPPDKAFSAEHTLYFTSTEDNLENVENYQRQVYTYDFSSDVLTTLTETGWYGAVSVIDSEHLVALIDSPTDNDGADNLIPAGVFADSEEYIPLAVNPGYNDIDVTVSPDEASVALAQQSNPDSDPSDISSWQVVVTNSHEETEVIIPGAVSPQWFSDSQKLMIVKTDGVYVYDLSAQSDTLVFGDYSGLDSVAKVALAPNNERFVLVIPAMQGVSAVLYNPTDQITTEYGRFFSDQYYYFNPIFSPDSQSYALLRTNEDQTVNDPVTIEVRAFTYAEPVLTKTFDSLKAFGTALGDWVDLEATASLDNTADHTH